MMTFDIALSHLTIPRFKIKPAHLTTKISHLHSELLYGPLRKRLKAVTAKDGGVRPRSWKLINDTVYLYQI